MALEEAMVGGNTYTDSSLGQDLTAYVKIIEPERFAELGIDPDSVLVGTKPAENHPGYLLSRLGGNAFGLGLVEMADQLDDAQAHFLEDLDLADAEAVAPQAARINALFERFGLLIRYSNLGRPYYLIPLAWLAQSTAEVQDRADLLEAEIQTLRGRRRREQLSIIIYGPADSLLTAEMLRRAAGHRVVLASDPAQFRRARGPFDLALVIQDVTEMLTARPPVDLGGPRPRKRDIFALSQYLMVKLYDLLGEEGRLVMTASRQTIPAEGRLKLDFPNKAELRNFLIFSHVYRTELRYRNPDPGQTLEAYPVDVYRYLTQEMYDPKSMARLTGGVPATELKPAQIDALDWLDVKSKTPLFPDQKLLWKRLAGPLFEIRNFEYRPLSRTEKFWAERLGLSRPLPPTELVFVGDKRRPEVDPFNLDALATSQGRSGCSLNLVADYKDSFTYLRRVVRVLHDIKQHDFGDLPTLEKARLSTPFQFKGPYGGFFRHLITLTRLGPRLRRLENILNPFGLEGERTPVMANLGKLSLLGLEAEVLEDIFLIITGHSAIGRITLGKVPERNLAPLTRLLSGLTRDEAVNNVRALRLMTVAEMAALGGSHLPAAQTAEVFALAEKIIRVSADPNLDWDRLVDNQIAAAGGTTNWSLRRLLKLFGLYEFVDDWASLPALGPHEKQVRAGYDPAVVERIEAVIELVGAVRAFKDRFGSSYSFERPYFFRRLLYFEFHGTARLLPALGPSDGFKLLWLVVNLSPMTRVNCNRLLDGPPTQDFEIRVQRIKEILNSLKMDDLSPDALSEIREQLSGDRPAFIRQAGLALQMDERHGGLNLSLYQIEDHLDRLGRLVDRAEGKPISTLTRTELREMNLLYGRLADYSAFLSRRPLPEIISDTGDRLVAKERLDKAEALAGRLEKTLSARLMKPEFLYDHLNRLLRTAPRLLDLLAPELFEMLRLPPAHPDYPGRTMLGYFLRTAHKFQALVSGDIPGFQNRGVLLAAALEEFGAEAGSGVGLSGEQLALLRELISDLAAKRHLLRAVGVGLVFQDVGRLPSVAARWGKGLDLSDHGLAGSIILVQANILNRYPMSPQAREAAVFLVRHHGLLGRVIRGEAPLVEMESITAPGDEDLVNAVFVHNVVALAAVRDLAMTADLFEVLNWLRTESLAVIRGERTWKDAVAAIRRNQGCLSFALGRALAEQHSLWPAEFGKLCRRMEKDLDSATRELGQRRVAGITRLFRLRGLWHLTYEAYALFRLTKRGRHVYRLLGLTSAGQASVERDLYEAVRLQTEGLDRLSEPLRDYLLDRLADIDRPVVLFGFPYFSSWLSPVNRLTAAALGLKAAEMLSAQGPERVTVSFQHLEQLVESRYEFLNQALSEVDRDRIPEDGTLIEELIRAEEGFKVVMNPAMALVSLEYIDPLRSDDFAQKLSLIDDPETLESAYLDRLEMLHSRSENTSPHRAETTEIFRRHLERVIDNRTNQKVDTFLAADNLAGLRRLYNELTDKVEGRWYSELQMGRIANAFEVRRAQLLQRMEDQIRGRLEMANSADEIEEMWALVRQDMIDQRDLIGKALEERIAQMFDNRLARLKQGRLW